MAQQKSSLALWNSVPSNDRAVAFFPYARPLILAVCGTRFRSKDRIRCIVNREAADTETSWGCLSRAYLC